MSEMIAYRAYLLCTSAYIREVRGFKAPDDESACVEADYMLSGSDLAAVEVYQGARMVWRRAKHSQVAA